MKTVVITGSTRGIGFGLADAFLDLDCAVVVSGRSSEGVKKAFAELATRHEPGRVFGYPCDVTDYEQVQALWEAAKERFDAIIFGVSPVMSASESAAIGLKADDVVLVIKAKDTQKDIRAKKRIQNSGGNILGAVLNCVVVENYN